MQPYVFFLIELQGLPGDERLLPKWRQVEDQRFILLSKYSYFLLASITAGAGVHLVHVL
jgi:hypothetical protein